MNRINAVQPSFVSKGNAKPNVARSFKVKPDVVCQYCKRLTKKGGGYTRDHVFPLSMGGKDKGNIVHCCKQCNEFKRNYTLIKWLEIVDSFLFLEMPYYNYDMKLLGQVRKSINKMLSSK